MKPSIDLKREITKDKDAQTSKEIAEETGLAYSTVRIHAKRMVKNGIWKEVLKKVQNRVAIAYIKIK